MTADLIERFDAFMAEAAFNTERLHAFLDVLEAVRLLPEKDRLALAERHRRMGNANFVRLHSVVGYLTGDPHEYSQILNWLTLALPQVDPAMAHFILWGIQTRVFLGGLRGPKAAGFGECDLFRFYQGFVRTVADRFGIHPARRPVRPGPIRKVCFVTNQFLGSRHQTSRDVFDFAGRMRSELGIEAVVINANLMPLRVEALFFPPFIAGVEDEYEGVRRMRIDDWEVPVASFTSKAFDAAKLSAIAQTIEGFDPDLLVAFGGTNVAADLFVGARPTICLPTTTGISISLADLLLGFDDRDWTAGLDELYRGPFAGRFRPFAYGYSLPPTDPGKAGDFGFDGRSSLAFFVVGNRLDDEVDETFLSLVDDVLDAVPESTAVFAGEVSRLPGRIVRARNAGRMRSLGYVNDVRALYGHRGVFLNPPRQGGGGSGGYALAEGVPVVTFRTGDVAAVAGPEFQVDGHDGYVAAARRLAHDQEHFADMADRARKRFAIFGDRSRLARQLLEYAEDLRSRYASS